MIMRGGLTAALFGAIIFASALAFPIAAQVVVEDEIVTADVSLFDVKPAAYDGRSIAAAMGLSAALPGMGHYYIGKPVSAWTYLSIDFASIFGALAFHSLAGQRENEARSYAARYAGIEKPARGEAYWRHVGAYLDAAEYNDIVELSRGDAGQILDPENWWRWADESDQDRYNSMRRKARNMRVASSFFIGALVTNRVVSMIDLRVFHRKGLSSGVRFESAVAPDMSGAAVSLSADF